MNAAMGSSTDRLALQWPLRTCHVAVSQVAGPINTALAKLRSAGAILVPFDSSAFQELAVSAWPGATADTIDNLDASSAYESIEVLGRQAFKLISS